MNNNERNCTNCGHRYGFNKKYYTCIRTGFYCETEMKFGNLCGGENLKLWTPRTTFIDKVVRIFSTPAKSGEGS